MPKIGRRYLFLPGFFDAREKRDNDQQNKGNRENVEATHKSLQSRQGALPGAVSHFVSKAAAPVQAGGSQVMVI